MGIFKIPNALCDTLNSTLSKYWWGQMKDEKKIHWINWERLCSPKPRGGMGFQDIQAFNLALLAKQAWRLIHNTHSLFYWVYKSRYFPNCFFMEAKLGNNPSYVWRSLLAARNIIYVGSKWKVGDGWTIGVSTHNWLSHESIFLGEQQQGLMVKDLIDGHTKQWDRERIFDLFAHKTRMEILVIPLQQDTVGDALIWKETKSGSFSVKFAYQVAIRMRDTTRVEHSVARKDGTFWRKM
nr:uncharacterized protein LOC111999338 [Quercus suber]